MSRYMEHLEGMLCDELDKIAQRGELTAGTLDTVQKLTHSLKSIKTIEAMDDSGYSGGMYPTHYNYDGGNSYARGRGSYANRDSMGRYSRAGGYTGRGYSRDGEKDHMLNKIEELRQSVEKMEE